MKIGFYPGSFDPFTNGHLRVVKRSSLLFDKVVIGIGLNEDKKVRYNHEDMKEAIKKVLEREGLTNVEVVTYNNLTVDAARDNGAELIIRGIRNGMDYDYEENLALINEEISGLDTIYIRAGNLGYISSSFVVQLLQNGRDISGYVPQEIYELIKDRPVGM